MDPNWKTRYTLIERLHDANDRTAWEDFDRQYRPFIYYILNQMQVSPSDHDDLAQEILLQLYKKVDVYTRERARFRTWLGTIIRNTTLNYFDRQNRHTRKKDALAENEAIWETHKDSAFDDMVENEWKQYLTTEALKRLRNIFSDKVVDCFQLTMQNVPVDEIAQRLGVEKDTVYTIRSRMKPRVLHEMQTLMEELEF